MPWFLGNMTIKYNKKEAHEGMILYSFTGSCLVQIPQCNYKWIKKTIYLKKRKKHWQDAVA